MVAAEGSHAIALAGDAALPEFAEDAVQKTLNAFGRIDILVNNAGVQYLHDSIRNITSKQLFDTFAVNVYSAFFMSQACLKHMCVPAMHGARALALTSALSILPGAAAAPSSTPARWPPTRAAATCWTTLLPRARSSASPTAWRSRRRCWRRTSASTPSRRASACPPFHAPASSRLTCVCYPIAARSTISPMVEATYSRASRLHPAAAFLPRLTRLPCMHHQTTRFAASARKRPWAAPRSRRRLRRRTSSWPPTSTPHS